MVVSYEFEIAKVSAPGKLFQLSLLLLGKVMSLPLSGALEKCFPQTLYYPARASEGQTL